MSYIHEQFNYLPVRAEKATPMTTKLAMTINVDELEELMQDYIKEAWDGKEFTMPLTLSGLLVYLRKLQKENHEQAQSTSNN